MRRSKIFNLSAISIIACNSLQAVICIFMDLFFISRILNKEVFLPDGSFDMKKMALNIIFIGLFYVVYYITLTTQYHLWGYVLRKVNKSIFVSIGSVILTMVIFLVYFLDPIPYILVPVVAFCYGVGFGFFSQGYMNLATETISSKHQVRFFAVNRIMFQTTYIIFPITLGLIIDKFGFTVMSLIMLAICLFLIIFSFLIRPKKIYTQSFKPYKFLNYLRQNKNETKPLFWMFISDFFRGASYDSFTTLITILVMTTFKSNTSLGMFQSIFTACSLVTMFFYLKFYRKKRADWFILPSIILVTITVIGIVCATNQITIITFYAVYTILNVILMSVSDSRRSGVVRMLSLHTHILDANCLRETFLGIGRVTSSLAILFGGLFDMLAGTSNMIFLKIGLLFVCLMYVGYGLTLSKLEKVLVKQDQEFRQAHIAEEIEKAED